MLQILLLSEDRSDDAFPTLQALIRKMLRIVAPQHRELDLQFVPLSEQQAQQAVHGNGWRSQSPKDRQKRIALMKTLVASVLMSNRVVIFHVDGDAPWSQRESSRNRTQFLAFLSQLVTQFEQPQLPGRRAEDLRCALAERLILLMPYYSIEAWLYQNTACALSLCDTRYQGKGREAFVTWQKDRARLDEECRPKDHCVLADRHNRALAETAYPAAAVFGQSPSFTDAVERLAQCTVLAAALAPRSA